MALNFLKSLEADDIFISYSREDGTPYLIGLDAALSKRGFSCFTDKRGTDAGRLPPATLYRKVRLCKTFVLLATKGALSEPDNIAPEVTHFASANGTSRIICVSFDADQEFGDWAKTPWYSHVEGKAREREHPDTLKTGEPSEKVVAQIVAASDYMKSKDRLRKYRNRALAGFLCLLLAGLGASGFALYSFRQATRAKDEANDARKNADIQIAKAQADIDTARKQAQSDIEEAQRVAQEKISAADALAKTADEKRKTAETQAKAAEKLRDAANREAHFQTTIAYSRSLANHSQQQLRQRPEEVQNSLKSAVDSMKAGISVGLHPVEADTALRESLALLPRQLSKTSYVKGEATGNVTVVALSPDGRFFGSLVDNALTVSEVNGKSAPRKFDCQCAVVSLSNDGMLAAIVTNENALQILDLRTGQRRAVEHTAVPELVALSPNGRYLALITRPGEGEGQHSTISILDLSNGKTIKTYDNFVDTPGDGGEGGDEPAPAGGSKEETLNMLVHDVSFGPTGNLAVGGKDKSGRGGLFGGRIVIWNLSLFGDGDKERDLGAADFNDMEIVQQREEVWAIAPGTQPTQFATDLGVWKRLSGKMDFEPVGRLPYEVRSPLRSSIQKLSFGPDGHTLTLFRKVAGEQRDQSNDEGLLETWDAMGHWDFATTYPTEETTQLGFSRDGQFFTTAGRVFATSGAQETESLSLSTETEATEARAFSATTDYFIGLNNNAAVVVDLWNKKETTVNVAAAFQEVKQAAISPGGRFFAVAGTDKRGIKSIVVYRSNGDTYETWKTIPAVKVNSDEGPEVKDLSLSADGRRLAVVYEDGSLVRVWDVAAARDISPVCLEQDPKANRKGCPLIGDVSRAIISPTGNYLLLTTDDLAGLMDLSKGSGAELKILVADTVTTALTFSADGRYLGIGSDEGILHVFESAKPNDEIAVLQHTGKVTAVAFSNDGKYVATASSDKHPNGLFMEESFPIRIWLLQPQDLLREATARLDSLSRP